MANRTVLRDARFKEELLRDLTQVSPDKYQTKTEWLQATIQTAKASVQKKATELIEIRNKNKFINNLKL